MDFLHFTSRDGGSTRSCTISPVSGFGRGSGTKRIRLICLERDDSLFRGELGGGVLRSASLPRNAGLQADEGASLRDESRKSRASLTQLSCMSLGGVGGGCCAVAWNIIEAIEQLFHLISLSKSAHRSSEDLFPARRERDHSKHVT